jgi:hypothetical protein
MDVASFLSTRWWLFPIRRGTLTTPRWTLAVLDARARSVLHLDPDAYSEDAHGRRMRQQPEQALSVSDDHLDMLTAWYVSTRDRVTTGAPPSAAAPQPPGGGDWTAVRLDDGLPQQLRVNDSGAYVAGFIECIMAGTAWTFGDGDGAALRAHLDDSADARAAAVAAHRQARVDGDPAAGVDAAAEGAGGAADAAASASPPSPPQPDEVVAGDALASPRGVAAADIGAALAASSEGSDGLSQR